MNYQFVCDSGHEQIISMPIKEYTSENYFCEVCGKPLRRPISSLACGYRNDKDFFGKATQHD